MQATSNDSTGTLFSDAKHLPEILTGAPNAGGVGKNGQLLTNNSL